ncbi:hypothetical protein A3860_26780 [Niastella vici]|uniref:ADP ribosyltransferase domain-containing protein n=1 Tax=Niastella vici TaxID=1703345 RepID=A0A1V9FW75_9BACT|nr:ADP-ribosyltransferase domain-containing protein [Niastella vici]OQP62619.1 hypothetical protein A3860_26780 [Niastella vici]
MRNIVALLLVLTFAGAAFNNSFANNPGVKTGKQQFNERVIDRLSKQFVATVTYNKTHKNKKYYIKDAGDIPFFNAWFSSENASKLLLDNYLALDTKYEEHINDYINKLREQYLPEKYKDFQIYFMVAGMFYTPDVSKTDVDMDLDWKKVRSISFDNMPATATNAPYATGTNDEAVLQDYDKRVTKAIFETVQGKKNITISKTDKTIIIYKWFLFDIDFKDGTLESYLKGNTTDANNMLNTATSAARPVMFMEDGCLYKKSSAVLNEITSLQQFLALDGDNSDLISVANMTEQRNKLMKDVTNAFVYFYQKENSLIPDDFCTRPDAEKETILGKLAATYKNAPTGDWETAPFRNPILFSNINWETRKCILSYLLNKTDCNDAKGMFMNNACENMVIDAIGGVRESDKTQLLEYFNDPIYFKKLVDRLHDAGGEDNYTGVIYALASMAASVGYWDENKNDISDALFDFHNTKKDVATFIVQETDFDQSIDYSKGLHFKISCGQYSFSDGSYQKISSSEDNFDCKPFTPVQFVYSDKLEFVVQKPNGTYPVPGEIVTVPALYLQWLVSTDFKMSSIKKAHTTLMVVSLLNGVGTFATATSIGARIWAAGDVLATSASLVCTNTEFRSYVKERWGDDGLDVLGTINTLGSWYGGAYLGRGALKYLADKIERRAVIAAIGQMRKDIELARRFARQADAIDDAAVAMDKAGMKLIQSVLEESEWAVLFQNSDLASYKQALLSDPSLRKLGQYIMLEEEAVIKYYTTNAGYKEFNKALRGEITMTDFFIKYEKALNQALSKLPAYPQQAVLWRGLKEIDLDRVKDLYKVGTVVTENGFVSCANNVNDFIKSSRMRDFNIIIKIEGKSGKLIQEASTLPEEAEVLIKSKTNFEVIKSDMQLHPDVRFEDANGYPMIWTIVLKEL